MIGKGLRYELRAHHPGFQGPRKLREVSTNPCNLATLKQGREEKETDVLREQIRY